MSVSAIRVPFVAPFLDFWTNNVNKYFYKHRQQRNCCSWTKLNSSPSCCIPNPASISKVDSICCVEKRPKKCMKRPVSNCKSSQSCSSIIPCSKGSPCNVPKPEKIKNRSKTCDPFYYRKMGRQPRKLKCPFCNQRICTRVILIPSRRTDYYAIVLCPLCLCFLPYFINATKIAKHQCPNCCRTLGLE
ncbi:uncharacterized protein LOC108732766 [Agrilus planipennis]|uniref:Uncharacterized protein LOC108732766 n=1 Tax=Agrilus planipennis TaxID=224129 RepID=A0A1W4W525_AGRPL|nr:uncharacterized protein LOC108732766 [Agrilus planipennis]